MPGKGDLLPEIEPIKKKKKQPPKKVIPIPYRRYLPDNHTFRELLYSYKHKQQEWKRKQLMLKKQQKQTEPSKEDDANEIAAAVTKEEEDTLPPLKRTKLAISSFVVRLTLGPREFPVKWAEDIAHVFGLQFAPLRDQQTGEENKSQFYRYPNFY